jgi:hypothetical protein
MLTLRLLLITVVLGSATAQLAAPGNLRVEGLKEEVAVLSENTPLFSFVPPDVPAGLFGTTQQSYRITVSIIHPITGLSDPTGHEAVGAPLWDSGDVASQKTLALVRSDS